MAATLPTADEVRAIIREEILATLHVVPASPRAEDPVAPEEAARRLGVSLRTVQRRLKREEIGTVGIGSVVRVVRPRAGSGSVPVPCAAVRGGAARSARRGAAGPSST